jgi:hypothetical protein
VSSKSNKISFFLRLYSSDGLMHYVECEGAEVLLLTERKAFSNLSSVLDLLLTVFEKQKYSALFAFALYLIYSSLRS